MTANEISVHKVESTTNIQDQNGKYDKFNKEQHLTKKEVFCMIEKPEEIPSNADFTVKNIQAVIFGEDAKNYLVKAIEQNKKAFLMLITNSAIQ